jgi:hypothetical protein
MYRLVGLVTGYGPDKAVESRLDLLVENMFIIFFQESRPALRLSLPPVQFVKEVLSSVEK